LEKVACWFVNHIAFVFLDAGQLYGRTEDIMLRNFVVNW
jgi:hypothetical protein